MSKENVAVIEVIDGPDDIKGRRFDHKGVPMVIGRAPQTDIVVQDSRVSKNHAVIESRNKTFYLLDLDSSNGTFLNGKRVLDTDGLKLQHGDDITFPGTKLKFYLFTGLAEKELKTIQRRISMNAIGKYSKSSAVLYTEILRFKDLYTKYDTAVVDGLRDKYSDALRELIHMGGPYYAAPRGEKAIAFFESGNAAVEFAKELMRTIERINLGLLRNAKSPIKKLEVGIGIDTGPLSLQLSEEGRIEHITGDPMTRARSIALEAHSTELWISDGVYRQIPKKLRTPWNSATPEEKELGKLHKYQSDTTAQL